MNLNKLKIKKCKLLVIFCLALGTCVASVAADSLSIFDFIRQHQGQKIIIETNIKELFKKRDKYQQARIIVTNDTDTVLIHEGEIRTRGNARKDICVLPPTKLRFDKSWLKRRGLSHYPTLKLVGACTLSKRDGDYVIAEQLIYETASDLLPCTFRTHPVALQYQDTKGKRKPIELTGFIIEHENQMASRNKSKVYDVFFKKESLDHRSYLIFSVFQFMIGNTDWKILNHHNLRVITNSVEKKAIPVPYDFDYSGLVKTHYAVPNDKLDINAVTDRLYLGPCQEKEEVEEIRQLFLGLEAKILERFRTAEMGKSQSKFCLRYLEEFFDLIRNKKQAERIFMRCIDY